MLAETNQRSNELAFVYLEVLAIYLWILILNPRFNLVHFILGVCTLLLLPNASEVSVSRRGSQPIYYPTPYMLHPIWKPPRLQTGDPHMQMGDRPPVCKHVTCTSQMHPWCACCLQAKHVYTIDLLYFRDYTWMHLGVARYMFTYGGSISHLHMGAPVCKRRAFPNGV